MQNGKWISLILCSNSPVDSYKIQHFNHARLHHWAPDSERHLLSASLTLAAWPPAALPTCPVQPTMDGAPCPAWNAPPTDRPPRPPSLHSVQMFSLLSKIASSSHHCPPSALLYWSLLDIILHIYLFMFCLPFLQCKSSKKAKTLFALFNM